MEQQFSQKVYGVVKQIPVGKVATYGQIAFLVGTPRRARQVGYVLSRTPSFLDLPCHRVVNRLGGLVPGWQEQRLLLEREGVRFRDNGTVDFRQCIWNPEEASIKPEKGEGV